MSGVEKINFCGWPNCFRISNDEIEIIVTTDIGPRIIRLGFIGQQNFFFISPEQRGKIGGESWNIYGGHRLWHAPEAVPRSYYPDNESLDYSISTNSIRLTQQKEETTGIVKEIEIYLSLNKNQAKVIHRLFNKNLWDINLAPWALSVLAQGGRAIIPQEPYGEGDDYLLPARPMALWHYTEMKDNRWLWGNKYIQARHDPSIDSEQKIGVLNKRGWTAYYLNGELLVKRFNFNSTANYPDYGCNNETYINGQFLEMETLGELTEIPPEGKVEHIEYWQITKTKIGESEESIDSNLIPIINSFNNEHLDLESI